MRVLHLDLYVPTGVMDDVFDNTTDVAVAFCVVEITMLGRSFSVVCV